jgi:hypothetical protein
MTFAQNQSLSPAGLAGRIHASFLESGGWKPPEPAARMAALSVAQASSLRVRATPSQLNTAEASFVMLNMRLSK